MNELDIIDEEIDKLITRREEIIKERTDKFVNEVKSNTYFRDQHANLFMLSPTNDSVLCLLFAKTIPEELDNNFCNYFATNLEVCSILFLNYEDVFRRYDTYPFLCVTSTSVVSLCKFIKDNNITITVADNHYECINRILNTLEREKDGVACPANKT